MWCTLAPIEKESKHLPAILCTSFLEAKRSLAVSELTSEHHQERRIIILKLNARLHWMQSNAKRREAT